LRSCRAGTAAGVCMEQRKHLKHLTKSSRSAGNSMASEAGVVRVVVG
jgi:hypothetical protein